MHKAFLTLVAASGVLAAGAAPADAQIYISGGISVGIPVAPPPIVVYQPAPPPMIVYQPAPPPMVVVRPAPVPVPAPPALALAPLPPFESEFGLGLRLNAGLSGTEEANVMGGGGVLVRFNTYPHVMFELGLDAYGGQGYAGAERSEVAGEAAALWFFGNPRQSFRVFLITGLGAAWSHIGEDDRSDEPFYVGGFAGLGAEWRLFDGFALEADLRGFIRHRVNDRPSDPGYFTDPMWNDGSCRGPGDCTDLEGGATLHLGALLYF
jgi:hypothetical protein